MDKKKTPRELKSLVYSLRKELPDVRIILFGSRARGEASKWSDYDFLLISKGFEGMNPFARLDIPFRYQPLELPMDFICLTPQEYEERIEAATVVTEAAREGVELIA